MAARMLTIALIALAIAAGGCGIGDWEPREVPRDQSEAELARVLEDAEAAAGVEEIKIEGRDIWAIAADAALTVHPECASVAGSGRSSYARVEMGVVEGLGDDSPLPVDIEDWYFFQIYGEPSRAYIDKRRIVLLWLQLGAPRDVAAVAAEYVPESDGFAGGPEVEWRRTAEVRVSYCYDADGEELANFDRAALPRLDLSTLDGHSAFDEIRVRVRQPGEVLCGESMEAALDVTGLDRNAPDYSGLAAGADPTPAILDALRGAGQDPDDFELWYVNARRALFASLDDREQDSTEVGQVAQVTWLGFNAERIPVWGVEFAGGWYLCDE